VCYALEKARQAGLGRVFACTTSEKVEGFFLRQGFEAVGTDSLPDSKWVGHSEERLRQVVCLARGTTPSPD
jgi:N-acetylglutamate synthase-like GNAT family acetyltransferase